MPKEIVYGEQLVVDNIVPIIEVRWNREGAFVQVVSKATSPDDGRVAGDSTETVVSDGFFVDLSRASINDLIRHLRRARDQAFGRDE